MKLLLDRAIEVARNEPPDSPAYLDACRQLVERRTELQVTVHMVLPHLGPEWQPIVKATKLHFCPCGRSRLLLPERHRAFVADTARSLSLQHDIFMIPRGGSFLTSLMGLGWERHQGDEGKLCWSPYPLQAQTDQQITVADMRKQLVEVDGLVGYPITVTVGELQVPLGLAIDLSPDGATLVPDDAIQVYVAGTEPVPPRCDCWQS